MTQCRERTDLEHQQLEALIELSSLFDNYPQLYEMIGTYEVMQSAIKETMKTTYREGSSI